MTSEPRKHTAVGDTAALLKYYNFELGGDTAEQVVMRWTLDYDVAWVRAAAIEALYQGRYKAVSIEQILKIWKRRGQPLYHFKHDFERLVSRNLPAHLYPPEDSMPLSLLRDSRSPQLPQASRATGTESFSDAEVSDADAEIETEADADADIVSETYTPRTVDRFIPFSDRSHFLERLKSVARSSLQRTEESDPDADGNGKSKER